VKAFEHRRLLREAGAAVDAVCCETPGRVAPFSPRHSETGGTPMAQRMRLNSQAAPRHSAGWTALGLVLGGMVAWAASSWRGPGRDDGKQHASRAAALEPGRGRAAASPTQIPMAGWQDILWRTWQEIQKDRVMSIAAGVTYYALLALFPAIAAFVAIYGLFADPATVSSHLAVLQGVLPQEAMGVVTQQLERLSSAPQTALSVTFAVSLVLSLWSANSGTKAIFDALNIAYDEEEKRSFLVLNAVSLLFTLGLVAFALVALAAVVVLPAVLAYLPFGQAIAWALRIGRWVLLIAVVALGLAVLYRFGPSRQEPRWQWVSVGSVTATVLWVAASVALSWYAANFADYNKTYGSLGAVVGLMVWMWVSNIVVLIGAELNSEIEHQTARDTTTGAPKPLGARGATMADTVGKSAG
jgi:membrane protein